ADLRVDLGRRVHEDVTVLSSGHARIRALRRRQSRIRTPAWVRSTAGAYYRGLEQLVDVRSANRTVVAAAELDVLNGSPFHAELVGVGGPAEGVLGVTVATVEREVLRERHVAENRKAHFREALPHMQLTVDRLSGSTAGLQTVGKDVVGIELELLFAVLGTHVDRETILCRRQLHPVFAEVTRDGSVPDVLRRVRAVGRRNGQVD